VLLHIRAKAALVLTGRSSSCHMFYTQRVVDLRDGKPKWSGLQDESDLIEDSPADAIKKRKREVEEKEKEGGDEKK
jgi:hypothetical protein